MSLFRNPLVFLAIGVCAILLLPLLFMDGMFTDGLLYATVSKNYAAGLGSFWEMTFSPTQYTSFHEQPPLLFFLQGQFFRVLGDTLYTERVYSLCTAIACACLIFRIWYILLSKEVAIASAWFVLMAWFCMPVVTDSFVFNLEECTMSVFVLAACVHLIRALHLKERIVIHLLLAGIWLVLAGLTKGIQGLFLIGAPAFWWLCMRDSSMRTAIARTLWVVLPIIAFVVFACVYEPARASFTAYFESRFGKTFSGLQDTSSSRFFLLWALWQMVLPAVAFSIFLVVVFKKQIRPMAGWQQNRRLIQFFLLCGFSGILPLMITYEQRTFYLVTALPFLAFAAALFVLPQCQALYAQLQVKKVLRFSVLTTGLAMLATALVLTFHFAGTPKRDADFLHDLKRIVEKTGTDKELTIDGAIYQNWAYGNYAMRFYNIAFTTNQTDGWCVYLSTKPDSSYQADPLNQDLRLLHLYRRK